MRPAAASALQGLWITLSLAALAGLLALPWISVAPNRLLPGQAIFALAVVPSATLAGALLLLAALLSALRSRNWVLSAALVLASLTVLVIATGLAASNLMAGRTASARAMLGSGFWVSTAALMLLAVDAARQDGRARTVWIVGGSLAAMLIGAAITGCFDALSLAVEYRARSAALRTAFVQHLALSASALFLALLVAVPLGLAAFRRKRAEAATGAALSIIQVTPALALFGLLIPALGALLAFAPALRMLGLSAIGWTPALIGVSLYVALPLFRGIVEGLRAANPAAVEAARAMGFREGQLTREIRIPLGAPVLMGALRVAVVQSIGLVTLGGLIGAGGLGAVVFEGMSQLASDLILLGALPIVALAVFADLALRSLETRLEARRR